MLTNVSYIVLDVSSGVNTTFDIWWMIFMAIWNVLDFLYSYITYMATAMFDHIPPSAIPFMIGLFCYSFLDFLVFTINRQDESVKRTFLKIFYSLYIVFMVCFTVWRFGLVSLAAQSRTYFETMTEIIVFAVYFAFIAAVGYSFYKTEATKLRKGLLVILWALFLSITFIFAPIFEEWPYSYRMLQQVLLVVVLCVIPTGLVAYQNSKKSDV